jgi:hypothetical protein
MVELPRMHFLDRLAYVTKYAAENLPGWKPAIIRTAEVDRLQKEYDE